jgi:DNA polymerase-4
MAESISRRLAERGLYARTVTTKLRYGDFTTRTRSTTLPTGTDDARRIHQLACELLDRALADRPGALRLVGVGVSSLSPYRQLTLEES